MSEKLIFLAQFLLFFSSDVKSEDSIPINGIDDVIKVLLDLKHDMKNLAEVVHLNQKNIYDVQESVSDVKFTLMTRKLDLEKMKKNIHQKNKYFARELKRQETLISNLKVNHIEKVEKDIKKNKESIADIKINDIEKIETDVKINKDSIADIKAKHIGKVANDVKINKDALADLSTKQLPALKRTMRDIQEELKQGVSSVEVDIQKTTKKINSSVSELRRKAQNISSDVGSLKTSLKNQIWEMKSNISDITGKTEKLLIDNLFLTTNVKQVKDKLDQVNITLSDVAKKNDEVISGVAAVNSTLSSFKSLTTDIAKQVVDNKYSICESKERMGNLRRRVDDMNTKVEQNSGSLHNITRTMRRDIDKSIKNMRKIINEKVKMTGLKEFVFQMQVLQKSRNIYTRLGMSFEDIFKLLGKDVHVRMMSLVIRQLVQQHDDYKKMSGKWEYGINLNDIVRLTNVKEIKTGTNLTTVKKVDRIYESFENYFKRQWQISFSDVIKLTTKDDLKEMKISRQQFPLHLSDDIPQVLQKLDHMYRIFNSSYKEEWGIKFKNVIDITRNLNFTANDTEIPILRQINGWRVPGFNEYWGKRSFRSLMSVMRQLTTAEEEGYKHKLGIITQRKALKFVAGTFHRDHVAGYVEVFISKVKGKVYNMWGTIYRNGINDIGANLICVSAGYRRGRRDYGGVIDKDQSKMKCLIRALICTQGDKSFDECSPVAINTCSWDHHHDTSLSCYF